MAVLYLEEEHTRLKSYSATTKGGISTVRIDVEVTDHTRLGFLLSDLGQIDKDQKARKDAEKRSKAKEPAKPLLALPAPVLRLAHRSEDF